MTITEVEIRPIARTTDQIEFVDDLEIVVESEKCSCNAGDDAPF